MTSILENKHSWTELAEMFADRIEKYKFINPKDWKRHHFIEWFMERESLGLCFDWRLIARAYVVSNKLKKNHDHFTVFVGGEGTGKTTIAIQFMAWVSPSFNLKDVIFSMPDYVSRLQEFARDYKENKAKGINKSLQLDEGAISLFSRESLSLSNKLLAKTFFVQRFLCVNVGICIPHYLSLDNLIRNHRINTLIIIKKRGDYKCVVGKGIKIFNKLLDREKLKELIAIPIPYEFFWEGNFNKDFPRTISSKKYDDHKYKHIKHFLSEAKLEANTVKMVKVTILEKEFGIKKDTIVSEIHKGNIDGRKIGNQWFITKKAYDKLVMAGSYKEK